MKDQLAPCALRSCYILHSQASELRGIYHTFTPCNYAVWMDTEHLRGDSCLSVSALVSTVFTEDQGRSNDPRLWGTLFRSGSLFSDSAAASEVTYAALSFHLKYSWKFTAKFKSAGAPQGWQRDSFARHEQRHLCGHNGLVPSWFLIDRNLAASQPNCGYMTFPTKLIETLWGFLLGVISLLSDFVSTAPSASRGA